MKVVLVNLSDLDGGAARAANRLHKALQAIGVHSTMVVQSKIGDDYSVVAETHKGKRTLNRLRPFLESLPARFYPREDASLFSSSLLPFSSIVDKVNAQNPDIVHLHWTCRGVLSIRDLANIRAPIVWSLHDAWAFTGGCHYSGTCTRYQESCGKCPLLGSRHAWDLSRYVWRSKRGALQKQPRLVVVGLSRWLRDCAQSSSLLQRHRVVNLPNPIDTQKYRPVDSRLARDLLHLPQERQIIGFSAIAATSDPRKGFRELTRAFQQISSGNVALAVIGSERSQTASSFPFPVYYLGRLHDELSMQLAYSACDLMVVPSLQENLSNVIMESLSCATPVVAFQIGGNPDLIEHQSNGYLAQAFDPADLARGMDWILNHPQRQQLKEGARNKVLRDFEQIQVARRYVELYQSLLHA